ncbi:MAG TPA: hypothetical protein VEC57_12170 [Candidatus Limnocylindrales bacterium]|nr:hypothetical protein [Candidatus Limnocylindrales bacterium]
MFVIGVLCGIAASAAFVLYGNHDWLIELAEKARRFSGKWHSHDWKRHRGPV